MRNFLKTLLFAAILSAGFLGLSQTARAENFLQCLCQVTIKDYVVPNAVGWVDDSDEAGGVFLTLGTPFTQELNDGTEQELKLDKIDDCIKSVGVQLAGLVEGGKLQAAFCSVDECVKDKEPRVCPKENIPGYGSLKWEDSVGTEDNPVEIVMGSSAKFTIKASGSDSIEFKCDDCSEVVLTDNKDGTAEVVWDTASTKATRVFPLLCHINVEAVDTKNPSNSIIRKIAFGLKACSYSIKPEDNCNDAANKSVCENKCSAGSPFCMFVSGECKYKGALTTEEMNKVSADETKAYLEKTHGVPPGYIGALPPCAFYGTCRSVNDITQLLINFGKGMFAIMGTFAFAFFVYGGFTMIVSMGNAEKQKKGQQILVAAVIGIIIAFSAYALIQFMLNALNVAPDFRGIK